MELDIIFKPADQFFIQQHTAPRAGESKIGEFVINYDEIQEGAPVKYILVHVNENLGPQGNCGRAMTYNTWESIMGKFLNMQANHFIIPEHIGIWGSYDIDAQYADLSDLRNKVAELDTYLISVFKEIYAKGAIPVLIGGGHNNAYPLMKAANKTSLQVINCDPHADFRALEGRHSGNPFSYAYHEGILNQYTVFGLHKAYNSQHIINELEDQPLCSSFYLDDYLLEFETFKKMMMDAFNACTLSKPTGIELDLDGIKLMTSSAQSPVGITWEEARAYILNCKKQLQNITYFHFPEGAQHADEEWAAYNAKAMAYLLFDLLGTN